MYKEMIFLKEKMEKGVTETIQFILNDQKIVSAKTVLFDGHSERFKRHPGKNMNFVEMLGLMDVISENPILISEANEWYLKWENGDFPEYKRVVFNCKFGN